MTDNDFLGSFKGRFIPQDEHVPLLSIVQVFDHEWGRHKKLNLFRNDNGNMSSVSSEYDVTANASAR
jgi:hypothetical protein